MQLPHRLLAALLLLSVAAIISFPVHAARQVALLVGNAHYVNERPLANPVSDARLLAKILRNDLGFDVELVEDADRARLIDLIDRFQRKAQGADAAVFYFSGHGMQDSGKRNYLLPVDARIQGEAGIRAYGVQADEVVAALAQAAPRVSVVILDACRDNPYATATRSGAKGLARMEVQTDQELLIAYATRDGQVAQDGTGSNSPYAAALAKQLKRAGNQPLLPLFDAVADEVRAQTGNRQRPTRYGDLKTSTYLIANLKVQPDPTSQATVPDAAERAEWALAQVAGTPEAVQRYLNGVRSGKWRGLFVQEATALLNKLSPASVISDLPTPSPATTSERPSTQRRDEVNDLSGTWEGTYRYDNAQGRSPVRFMLTASFSDGRISGRISEPNTFGDKSAAFLFANIEGTFAGTLVRFAKRYDGTGGAGHSVQYEGNLDRSSRRITGQWYLNEAKGTFELRQIE